MIFSESLRLLPRLAEVPAEDWRALETPDFPFADYDFLQSLEATGCVGPGTGWLPQHLTLWRDNKLAGAVYLYLKSHSYGEFIFDFDWAHAFAQTGEEYYPKLVAAVPFTPATGPKLLTPPGPDRRELQKTLLRGCLDLAEERGVSSLHFLYLSQEDLPLFEEQGFLIRHSTQHHWKNRGFSSFEDYLASLKRKRRQQVVKECREVAKLPVELVRLQGKEITEDHLRAMIGFYQGTFEKKYSYPYLHPEFFFEFHRRQPDTTLLNLARMRGKWVAGSINFTKGKNLYGRYWGSSIPLPFLHFEICYYQNIRYAIARGLDKFEAGAGGDHKLFRGLSQQRTYSAHWFRDPRWHQAVANFLQKEKVWIDGTMDWSRDHDPYRKP